MTLEKFFTPAQTGALRAAIERIIPADDFPGGWEAGAGDFLTQLFTREPRFLPPYQAGLEGLAAEAQAAHGREFAALPPDAQDALLAQVEAGQVATEWPVDPAAFFRLLVTQTMEGFYADPGNGGNKGGIAWKMIGFEVTV